MGVLVFGAGSLGSLVGGVLSREHDVTLVGREPHVSAIREGGLRIVAEGGVEIDGRRDLTVRPAAVTDLDASMRPDLAVVTVKSFDTDEAARALAAVDPGGVLSLQNGMGNEETLADHLGRPVLAGTTTYGARLREPGVVACTGVGTVTLGPHGDAPMETAERAGKAFLEAGIGAAVVADPRLHLWEKLAVNAGINPVTALARVPNGAVVDGPAADLATRAAVETAAVARERGIDLPEEAAREAIRDVAATTAANRSSMLADVEGGRRTEIDAINGYVVERAGKPVPTNETLLALIRAWEAGEGLR
jgi:2-dehydropantoate 2-reductase